MSQEENQEDSNLVEEEEEEDAERLEDPNEDALTPRQRKKSYWASIKDSLVSLKDYKTSKDVRILDRRLGYIYYGTLTLIIMYLVVYVFIIDKQYLDNEKVEGSVFSLLLGVAYSTGASPYVWDIPEENPWGQETSAVFVPSKITVTKRQIYGLCADPLLYCETNADCSPIDLPNVIESRQCLDTTEGTKGCLAWRWCPPENSVSSEVFYLENAAHQLIWTRMKVKFKRLADLSRDNYNEATYLKYPQRDANAWEVSDITLMSGFNFSDVTEKGAVVQATIVLQCIANPSEECDLHLEAKRLDDVDSGGYSISHAEYYREGETLYRDLYHMKGVRILFNVVGIYISSSMFKIVLQLASALGLIIASHAITDGVMLNLLKEKSHFKKLKVEEIPGIDND